MKQRNFLLSIFTFLILFSTIAQTPAFPGAAGGGMFVTGGRGGKVLYVTSLADDGSTGTLRWAVNQSGARTILFKVSGTIALTSALRISNGNLTIAGQTAPGDGITLRNYETNINADNVIVRFIRFRLGNTIIANESDSFWGRYRKNIIIDHCSMSWSIDETASFYSNENFTMQWSVISESLNNAGHSKGAHGYGGLWGGKNASFHHNLIAHHNSRNPRFNGFKRSGLDYTNPLDEERLDYRNNVLYNWGDNCSYGGEAAGKYNIVNNYLKYGPGTKSSIRYKVTQIDIDASTTYQPQFGTYFISGNYVYGSVANTTNNWAGVSYASGVNQTSCKATQAFVTTDVPTHTAEAAYDKVLAYAGSSLARDTVDRRIVKETKTGTTTYTGSISGKLGIIDTQSDVGGWPVLVSGTAPTDTDADGIPDGWLDLHYPGKTSTQIHESGYTYLELYINSLVEDITTNEYQGVISSEDETIKEETGLTIKINHSLHTLELSASETINNVQIFDISGRLLFHNTYENSRVSINYSEFSKSIKIVRIIYNGGNTSNLKLL